MVRVRRLACSAVLHKATWGFVQLTSSVAWAGLHCLSTCLASAIVFPSCPTLPITVCISYPNGCPYVCWEIAPASPSASAPPREVPDLYPACIRSWCNATGPYSAGSERIKTPEWFWYALKNRILLINAFALTCTVRAHMLSAILLLSSLSFVHVYMKGSALPATRWKTMTFLNNNKKNTVLFALLSASSIISCNSDNYRCSLWALFNKRHILDL